MKKKAWWCGEVGEARSVVLWGVWCSKECGAVGSVGLWLSGECSGVQ